MPYGIQAGQPDIEVSSIQREILASLPGATHMSTLSSASPVASIYRAHDLLGYALITEWITPIPGYSGKPINLLVVVDDQDAIRHISIISHQEPILEAGVSEQALHEFITQYLKLPTHEQLKIGRLRDDGLQLDAISGATITSMVINASINESLQQAHALLSNDDQAEVRGTVPLWIHRWHSSQIEIAILATALVLLTVILLLQDWLARRPRFLLLVRDGYLLFTVLFIGGYTLGQLSIVNVFTFLDALLHDFDWAVFLMEPIIFMLWSFTAMTLLLWGRGVFCGWLCPFGALQELVNQLGRRLQLRQWEFPDVIHERLWALKYIILLVLFGISLQPNVPHGTLTEIEPFKTVVVMRFMREWGYVVYAVGLILISLVNRKLYCKYLCPLGAALAIPSRLRLFDWLRRRKECGRPCQICAHECEVRAINDIGEINTNECHYCLDCQVTYWNASKCPPLAAKHKKKARAEQRLVEIPVHKEIKS